MRKLKTFLTDREMVEASHISLLGYLGLEDISVRRYTLSERPICINAKYVCRYNSWELTILYKTSVEFSEGTLVVTNIESLIYGETYEVSIPLTDLPSSLNQLYEMKNIIDNEPNKHLSQMVELIADLEAALRSYGFKVSGILTPDLFYSRGQIRCVMDGIVIFVSISYSETGEKCLCISNSLNWKYPSQSTELIKGILIPIKKYNFDMVLNFIEKDLLKKQLNKCMLYQRFADGYSWHK